VLHRLRPRWALAGSALVLAAVGAYLITSIGGSSSSGGDIPRFRRVVLIVLENKSFGQVIGHRSAPKLNTFARRYALLNQFFAEAHPSLPNYLALVSGSTQGVKTNCTACTFDSRNLADEIEDAHRTWKAYAEGLPSPGFTGATSGLYAKKHNPFLYFRDILTRAPRRNRVVSLAEFDRDLARGTLPDFSYVEPDLCHAAHNCGLEYGDRFLGYFLPPLLKSPQLADGVVFVTFDEGREEDLAGGGGHVATLVLGPLVRPGARSDEYLTHYSILRTIEDAWGLSRLGASADAEPIRGIWR
jgi:phosphatidylinositol-3-phosphatase